MKITLLLVYLLFHFKISCVEEDKVLVLQDNNFDLEIKNFDYLMIEFYAPWCQHCISLAPEYVKAAEILRNENPPIYLAKIDATENKELAKRFSIEGFPTLKLYSKGQYKDYEGARSHEEIVKWIKKKTGPPSKQLDTIVEIEGFKKQNEIACLFFGSIGTHEFNIFLNVSQKIEDVFFAHTSLDELAQYYGVKLGQILLFKKFDEEKILYQSAEITEESLEQFLNFYSIPIISKFETRIAETIFGKNQIAFFLVRSSDRAEQIKFDPIIRIIAEKYRGKLIFVITDIIGELEVKLVEYLGINEKDLPQIRIINVKGEDDVKPYALMKEFTESSIDQFIQDFFEDKLEIYVKSEDIPTEQTGPVIKVVAKNFREAVLNSSKNVFIMFYAPWSPQCQELLPIFDRLANTFINETRIIFAKFDITLNEIEDGLTIEEYPTLKLYLANEKTTPIDYLEEKTYDELFKFVNELLYSGTYENETNQNKEFQTKKQEF